MTHTTSRYCTVCPNQPAYIACAQFCSPCQYPCHLAKPQCTFIIPPPTCRISPYDHRIRLVGGRMVAAAAWRTAAARQARWRDAAGPCDRCGNRRRVEASHGRGRGAISCSGRPQLAVLAVCDPSIKDGLAFATGRTVEHASWLHPCVRGELRTGLCGACMEVAAVAIAVDRSTVNGSRARRRSRKSTC